LLLQWAGMSDNSEMLGTNETPLAAVIDDSCTVKYIEIVSHDRPSDDSCLGLSAADESCELEGINQLVKLCMPQSYLLRYLHLIHYKTIWPSLYYTVDQI